MEEGMESKEGSTPSDQPPHSTLKCYYIKSQFFRVIHADGVWGGISPSGKIQVTYWNQRQAIPNEIIYALGAEGDVVGEVERVGKSGIVREVETSVLMDLDEAESFLKWLGVKVEELKRAQVKP